MKFVVLLLMALSFAAPALAHKGVSHGSHGVKRHCLYGWCKPTKPKPPPDITTVPELDASGLPAAVALILGGALVLSARRRRLA